jgi:anti-sigma regulatory factor (Ser/Thr protein kinase)
MTRFAAEIASTLDRIDLLDLNRRVPEQLQKMLLGPPRLVLGVGHCSRYIPGSSDVGIGGDWYDVFGLDDGKVGVAVGDAVGHGLEAAVVMGQLRSALAGCVFSQPAPAEALESLDLFARRIDAALSTTIVYAVIDTQQGTLDYCSAGHPPPLVVSPTGTPRYLVDAQTWPLAVHLDGRRRSGARSDFEPGSLLVLYSDGLVERRGESLDVGLDRLASVAARHWKLPTELLSDQLLAELLPDHRGRDDVALLVLRSPVLSRDLFLEKSIATRESISAMRHRLSAWLAQQPLTPTQARDVLTAVGEAYTNAVDHAYGRALTKPLARVEAARLDDGLLFTVTDTGRWRPSPRVDSRGLMIMHDLMSAVEIDRRPDGTTVSLRYDLPAEARAEAG